MSKRKPVAAATKKRPTIVGFVCEGSTDVLVLRQIAETILGDIDARTLQPETDALDRQAKGAAAGWSAVKAWCEKLRDFDDLVAPEVGDALDVLVIAIDLDIAVHAGLQKTPTNLKSYDAKQLCSIVKSWLPGTIPSSVVITIPVMSVESWVLAALFPSMTAPEQEAAPSEILVKRGKIPQGSKGPWKRVVEYRALAKSVAGNLTRVRKRCGEAERYVSKLESLASTATA